MYRFLTVDSWLFHRMLLSYSLNILCLEFEELSQLLKRKRVDASDPGRILDLIEVKKERLLAQDEERAKKQSEWHVLTNTMRNHPITKLFVSRVTRAQMDSIV